MSRDISEIISIKKIGIKDVNLGKSLGYRSGGFEAKSIFIFCEGKTEFNYFRGLNTKIKNGRVNLVPRFPKESAGKGNSGEGNDFEKLCLQVKDSIKNKKVVVYNDNTVKLQVKIKKTDEFNIIFDCDANFDKIKKSGSTKYLEGLKHLENYQNISLYLSNYNVEIWILCHFEVPPENLMLNPNNLKIGNILTSRIKEKRFIKNYNKNDIDIFNKLEDKLKTALENSDELIKAQKIKNNILYSKSSEPVTEIGRFIRKLQKELGESF